MIELYHIIVLSFKEPVIKTNETMKTETKNTRKKAKYPISAMRPRVKQVVDAMMNKFDCNITKLSWNTDRNGNAIASMGRVVIYDHDYDKLRCVCKTFRCFFSTKSGKIIIQER